ncbi:MAG: phosphatase PAP2 family protein [Myxococcota bacterium]
MVLGIASVRGFRFEHALFAGVVIALAQAGPRARLFSARIAPFVLVGIAYEFFSLLLPLRGQVHVSDLYYADLALFPSPEAGVTWPEWFATHNTAWLDVPTGVAYFAYLLEVFGVGLWLYFRDVDRMSRLGWGFVAVNVIGMVAWITWPAAPPWYVMDYGLGPADLSAVPSAAGALRFDELIGVDFFAGFYERSANVFGAMPSLHTAYPVVVACACWTLSRPARYLTVAFAGLVGFSAIYLTHHYVLDVLFGVVAGIAAYQIVRLAEHWIRSSTLTSTPRELAQRTEKVEAAG